MGNEGGGNEDKSVCGERSWAESSDGSNVLSIKDLINRVSEFHKLEFSATSKDEKEFNTTIGRAYSLMLDDRIRALDAAIKASLPDMRDKLESEVAKKNDSFRQVHIIEITSNGMKGWGPNDLCMFTARIRVREVHMAIFPREVVNEYSYVLGGIRATGEEISAREYESALGEVESTIGPIEIIQIAWGAINILRMFSSLALRVFSVQATRLAIKQRWFAKTTIVGTKMLPKGVLGGTDKYGNIVYLLRGNAAAEAETISHELVHSFLSPKLLPLRELRANIRIWSYKKVQFLRYLEEALAETFAQLRHHGVSWNSIVKGIKFPLNGGYHLELSTVVLQGVIIAESMGTIIVGGTTFYVYLTDDSKNESHQTDKKRDQP